VNWSLLATPVGNVIAVGVICWVVTDSLARTVSAEAIMRRLNRSGGKCSLRSGWLSKTWNPDRTVGDWAVTGKGKATYWLDDTGMVHLLFEPGGGAPRHLVGPRPTPTTWRKAIPVLVTVCTARAVALVSGGGIGYLLTPPADRATGVLTGAFIGLLAAWNAWPIVAALAYNRAARRARRAPISSATRGSDPDPS
jgi:hypothetical protein